MAKTALAAIVKYCDRLLRTGSIGDYDGAVNGLQVENSGGVNRIAATVDASLATVKLAIRAKADLLLVHHGLFWGPTHPWTGTRYALQRLLWENDLAVYSSHLPLDAHPEVGNNAGIARALGLVDVAGVFTLAAGRGACLSGHRRSLLLGVARYDTAQKTRFRLHHPTQAGTLTPAFSRTYYNSRRSDSDR